MIYPLVFGGFLSIEPDHISVYKKKFRHQLLSKKLRQTLLIKAITEIDEYDPKTKKTKEGRNLLRYLFGTSCGELYMMAFDLSLLHMMSADRNPEQFEADKFMQIEYLGSRLSNCTSLAYLDSGFLYYGSRDGDSNLLQLQEEQTRIRDQPYFTVLRTYANLGMVHDMQMKYSSRENNGRQNDLMVACGKGKNASISVLKKGISINQIQSMDSLPSLSSEGVFTIGDRMLLKFYGVQQIILIDAQSIEGETNSINLAEGEMYESLTLGSPEEEVHILR